MKNIVPFIIAVFLNTTITAQDTTCIKKKVDQFNNTTTYLITGDSIHFESTTAIYVRAGGYDKKSLRFFINSDNIRSVDEKSSVTFLFTDGTKQMMRNSSGYNLTGSFMLVYPNMKFGGGKKLIKEILEKKIKAIRLNGFTQLHDIEVPEVTATIFNQKLNCFFEGWEKYEAN